jgi:2,3-bisphosphoglycerate-dependent phosphoglycerate mutase
MTELLFIRHGETDWNRQHRFQGQIDVPLNATGQRQAARLAARLADDRHDLLLASDLQRALQTAAPLAAAWGLQAEPLPALREQGFGVFEGLNAATVQADHAELWRHWLAHDADFALPGGGESARQFSARVMAAVQALAAEHAGRRLAVVTHGGVLDMLWRHAHRLPLDGQRECAIPNTGLNRLRWLEGAFHIELWADASHLVDAADMPQNTLWPVPADGRPTP